MSEEKGIRAFLAIAPPKEIHEEMARIQKRLQQAIQGAIRWVRTDSIHLTLKFFGDIGAEDVGPLSATIEKGIRGVAPFSLDIRGVGVFPDARRPRVLWLGTAGDTERLTMTVRNLDRGFADLGFAPEERPFRAHWTLARIKSPQGLTGVARALETERETQAGAFTVNALVLFKSELRPQGAVYTRLAEYALKEH
jgi:RNA 2',3'-cyclic 3'-phosphodiesterase